MIHPCHAFRGRNSALSLKKVDAKGKKRRTHAFRESPDAAAIRDSGEYEFFFLNLSVESVPDV
jgi:hypothetical protein